MSRAQKSRPRIVPALVYDVIRANSTGKHDPFRSLGFDKLKLKPACPSRRYGSTLKVQHEKASACPPLPALKPTGSAGIKKCSGTSRKLTPVRVIKRHSTKRLSNPGDYLTERLQTPYFCSNSETFDDLSYLSTDPSSNESSPGKETIKNPILQPPSYVLFTTTFRA